MSQCHYDDLVKICLNQTIDWMQPKVLLTTLQLPVPHVYGAYDHVIKWKHLPRSWPFVRGIHRSPVNSHAKASDAQHWSFLWSAHEHWVNKLDGARPSTDTMAAGKLDTFIPGLFLLSTIPYDIVGRVTLFKMADEGNRNLAAFEWQ